MNKKKIIFWAILFTLLIVISLVFKKIDEPKNTAFSTQPIDSQIDQSPVYSTAPLDACPTSLTPAQTEGPYFKSQSPTRTDIRDGQNGTQIVVVGYVFDQNCKPIPNTVLDFWQADSQGNYDQKGYSLRGNQTTDETGIYFLQTIVPKDYEGHPPHIHVKIIRPTGSVFTTQLYVPEEGKDISNEIFSKDLAITIEKTPDGWIGKYNFKVETN